MATPSLYAQLEATQVSPRRLKPSPRHWNPGLFSYRGKLWLCYRYHLGVEHLSRCATAMVPLHPKTFQPTGESQKLNFRGETGTEHHEDARLFMFRGKPHISFTEMRGYQPGVDYQCAIKYAELKLTGARWTVGKIFHPQYGRNNGQSKEKNWVFFEHDNALHCIYSDTPTRKVIRLDGETMTAEYESKAPNWPWGEVRGGSPPILRGNEFTAIFHSSLPTEVPPHFVRYYSGIYSFEAKPPFALTAICARPLMAGSETDGHGYDPRYAEGWKPFVVFPCGLIEAKGEWLISLGVNDWQCAIAKVKPTILPMVSPDGTGYAVRYFRSANGTLPVRVIEANAQAKWLDWQRPKNGGNMVMALPGYLKMTDPREADELAQVPNVREIDAAEYALAVK